MARPAPREVKWRGWGRCADDNKQVKSDGSVRSRSRPHSSRAAAIEAQLAARRLILPTHTVIQKDAHAHHPPRRTKVTPTLSATPRKAEGRLGEKELLPELWWIHCGDPSQSNKRP